MAHAYPSELPSDIRATQSERELFNALQEQLSDDYHVYFGMPFIESKTAEQGEVDFIILHPTKGMLFVECKGKGIGRNHDGSWYRTKGRKRERLRRTPIEQVKKQLESLVTKFRAPCTRLFNGVKGRFPMPYGWALAFPFTGWPASEIPPDVEPEVFLDAEILHNAGELIERAFDFWQRKYDELPQLEPGQFDIFRNEVLSPELELVPNLGGALASERQKFIKLSERQASLARMFVSQKRLIVSGGAGTGKTVLAMHCARLLAAQGKRVLLLCFNRALADHMREDIADEELIAATNFHRLCIRAGYAIDEPLKFPDDPDTPEFWIEEAPMALWRAIDTGALGPWDAIIVDEAQDFARDWWGILEVGLAEDGHLAVFYDRSQSLFDHGDEIPSDLGVELPLTENFRNTVAIADTLQELVPSKTTPHGDCVPGEPPTVFEQQGPAWTRRKLAEIITNLMEIHGVRFEHMAILTPRTPKNSVLEAATVLEGIPIVHELENRAAGVLHSSISGFKGLEADIVFMLDIDPDHDRCSSHARYVAASRARHRLYVFQVRNWLD